MKKMYKRPELEIIEMDKEILGLVTASRGDNEAWNKKNNNLLDMESDKEDEEEETKYNLWSE